MFYEEVGHYLTFISFLTHTNYMSYNTQLVLVLIFFVYVPVQLLLLLLLIIIIVYYAEAAKTIQYNKAQSEYTKNYRNYRKV